MTRNDPDCTGLEKGFGEERAQAWTGLKAVRNSKHRVRRSERQGKPLTKLAQGAKTLESSVSQLRGGVSRRNVGHGR